MSEDYGVIKQIIIVTDGRSNIGGAPEEVAARAYKEGIIVSGIGIIDNSGEDENDIREVESIAKSGGGISDYCFIEQLNKTLQALTQQTINKTLECIVNKQLESISGVNISDIEPKSRNRIINFIEDYGDNVELKCIILLDTSKSMTNKIPIARECIEDLLQTLNCRKGELKLAIIIYPGTGYDISTLICPFTNDALMLETSLKNLVAKGGTPTAPALDRAIEYMKNDGLYNEEERLVMDSHHI